MHDWMNARHDRLLGVVFVVSILLSILLRAIDPDLMGFFLPLMFGLMLIGAMLTWAFSALRTATLPVSRRRLLASEREREIARLIIDCETQNAALIRGNERLGVHGRFPPMALMWPGTPVEQMLDSIMSTFTGATGLTIDLTPTDELVGSPLNYRNPW